VTEVDPDPGDAGRSMLGDRAEPDAGDPTAGGRRGEIGEAPSIAADEPGDGSTYSAGADPGADA
jgi:hypothetical protein